MYANNGHHQIALTMNGHVYGTGGQIVSPAIAAYFDFADLTTFKEIGYFRRNNLRVKQVACSNEHSIFLSDDGELFECGTPEHVASESGHYSISKLQIPSFSRGRIKMTAICCGNDHTLSLGEDGRVWSWGRNNEGQLGLRHTKVMKSRSCPKLIPYFEQNQIKCIQISSGMNHNLCLDTNHRVHSWGHNADHQCGHDIVTNVSAPKIVSALQDVEIVDIKTGHNHNVATSKDSTYWIWGSNRYHQCFRGDKQSFLRSVGIV